MNVTVNLTDDPKNYYGFGIQIMGNATHKHTESTISLFPPYSSSFSSTSDYSLSSYGYNLFDFFPFDVRFESRPRCRVS